MAYNAANTPGAARPGAINVAVDPVALVVTECITVTSAMRKHARWAHSSVSAILGGGTSSRLEARRQGTQNGEKDGSTLSVTDDVSLASRWGLRGKKGQSMQDNPLLSAFARLRSDLKRCKDIHAVDAPSILHPFLQVIRSSSTSAPITSLALIAITKFFAYNIISKDSPQLPLAMQRLSSAVTHCRFEASDSATDEIVLFRILKLMEGMINGPGGDVIGDESMCEMMETGISMCCQVRLSELLRRSAEVSMVTMCQTIFERLKALPLEVEEEEAALSRKPSRSEPDSAAVKMDPSISGDMIGENRQTSDQASHGQSLDVPRRDEEGRDSINEMNSSHAELKEGETDESTQIKPYGLASIRELFRVLVDLLDPHEKQHNDTMRVMALRIVDVALEVAGPSIASHPSLATLAKDTLCRHLFQLVRSENISILNESLRVAGTLLSTCRRVLKLQQELFLSYLVACLHPRVEIPQEAGIDPALYEGVPQAPRLAKPAPGGTNSGRSTPVPVKDRARLGLEGGTRKPDAREAMVESVGALVRIPSFMAELFVNYDCEIDRSDLCVDMVGLLARNAFPDAATWSTTNVPPLCLDALLGYIQSVADRVDDVPDRESIPELERLRKQRDLKRLIIRGTTRFNENPKSGIVFLAQQRLITNPDDPNSVAEFLKGTTRVDKKVLGDYISKGQNEKLLSAFMGLFDFSRLRVDEALRLLLNSFRLPGEAPLISRILTEFAEKYYEAAQPADIAGTDEVYVLTYAIIMLNTDQHNPNVKNQARMRYEDFAKNLRGVNGNMDFDPDFLNEIFESIRTREIILPEEHDNKSSYDHAWKDLLFKIQSTSDLTIVNTNVFDADMFAATWKPIVATLTYVFLSATDDTVFSRVVAGFDQCAQIAAKYDLHDALDHIVFSLSSVSSLSASTLPSTSLNTEVSAGEKSVMVSETAVRFGRDFKAQLATVVLFRLVVGNEHTLRDGWNHLVRIILNLFINSLISNSYTTIKPDSSLPDIPLQSPAQVIDRQKQGAEGGIFSAFTSYVSSFANDEPPEPSDQEIEYTLCTVDCVNACSFDQLFQNISKLPTGALKALVDTLLSHLPEDASPKIMVVKPDIPAPTPIRPNGSVAKTQGKVGVAYDPSLVFVLELSTLLASRDSDTITECGKEVANALQSVVRDSQHVHPVTLSRSVYYLLSFLHASHDHDFVRAPVVLHTIAKFSDEMLHACAPNVMAGLKLCLSGPAPLRNEIVNSPDFWLVLEPLTNTPSTAAEVFALLSDVVSGPRPGLTADNYDAVASLLNAFAMTAGQAARTHRQRDAEAQRNRQPRPDSTPVKAAIERGAKAMSICATMTERVPIFVSQSHLESRRAWKTYWSRPLRCLLTHASNPVRSIRAQSLASLQRILLSPALASVPTSKDGKEGKPDAAWLFTHTLFPLLVHLLKPEVWHSDPSGMGETRLGASLLTCKVFLRFLDNLFSSTLPLRAKQPESSDNVPASPTSSENPASPAPNGERAKTAPAADATEAEEKQKQSPAAVPIFLRTLDLLERLIKSTASAQQPSREKRDNSNVEALEEAIPESLKNVILVMSHAGYLQRPEEMDEEDDDTKEWKMAFWQGVESRLERFVPGFLAQIMPPPQKQDDENEVTEKMENMAVDEKAEKDSVLDDKGGGRETPTVVEQEVKG